MVWIIVFVVAIIIACIVGDNQAKETETTNKRTIEKALIAKHITPRNAEFGTLFNPYIAFGNNVVWCAIFENGIIKKELTVPAFQTNNYACNWCSLGDKYSIMADSVKKELAIVTFSGYDIGLRKIAFNSIVSVEQVKNGSTIYQKSILGTAGRALVGGVLAGGAGAIVGGSTAKQTGSEKCTSLITKIQLKEINNPSCEIVWYKGAGMENIENGELYAAAQKSLDIIKAIIANNEEEVRQQTSVSTTEETNTLTTNVADEISKLHKLMTDGIITNEEFEAHKKKILNN